MPRRSLGARSGRGWDATPRPARDHGADSTSSRDGASRRGAGGPTAHRTGGVGARAGRTSDPSELAREICLEQLAIRPRTRSELASALRRRGIAADVAAEVLGRYTDVGIVDDRAFARAWVTSRHHGRGLARRALAGELRRKGVGSTDVDEALHELDDDTEAATARALVDRRLRAERGLTQRPDVVFRRLVGMLARKGYPPGIAIGVVKEALAGRTESAEYADLIDVDALVDADSAMTESDPDTH
ncbi:MAG: regulatory protein RecX [Micromonosporaceae bacterium]